MITKEHIEEELRGKTALIAIIGIIFFLGIVASFFCMIWYEFIFGCKVLLTSLIGLFFTMLVSKVVDGVIKELAEESFQELQKPKQDGQFESKFQQRLYKMAKERGYKFPES